MHSGDPPSSGRASVKPPREPQRPEPAAAGRPPRRTSRPFPPYRFLPGGSDPHPVRDPRGHSHGRAPEPLLPWGPDRWRTLEPYLFAVDLYNYGYWWESHETLEGLWHAAGHTTIPARFVQGLIHAAAAAIHAERGGQAGARRQAARALRKLEEVALVTGPTYMGLEIPAFVAGLREAFLEPSGRSAYAAGPGGPPPGGASAPFILLRD